MKRVFTTLISFIFLGLLGLGGCGNTVGSEGEGEGGFSGIAEVESFRGNKTILVKWRQERNAYYKLMRGIDGVNGVGEFEEVYAGREQFYLDWNVENDIRYLYRLDKQIDGQTVIGRGTVIGVGSGVEVDKNEPNDTAEQATVLSTFKKAHIYYFRYSDGRTLEDVDFYKVNIKPGKTVKLRVTEEGTGIGEESALYAETPGKGRTEIRSARSFEIRNTGNEDTLIFALSPAADRFVEPGLAGGTVRVYRVEIANTPDLPGGGGESGNSGGGGGSGGGGEIAERSELFIADRNGRIVFLTNEMRYAGGNYTFWKTMWNNSGAFTEMRVELVKESGNYAGGYGFFFNGCDSAAHGECMQAVLIQKDGNYAVGKVAAGVYTDVIPWKSSGYLRKGYGVRNTVGVRREGGDEEYVLLINGNEVDRFIGTREAGCGGSRAGVIAVVSWMEQFPVTPVKVGYTLQ